jgi:hypothetical protein
MEISSVLGVLLICTSGLFGADHHVPGEYPTIQAAINAAVDGDSVVVAEGVYTGAGNKNLDFGGKPIMVRSADPQDPCVVAATVINCQNSGRGFYFNTSEDANSIVSGFTITRGSSSAIHCEGSSPTIRNCIIVDNTAPVFAEPGIPELFTRASAYGGGMYCTSNSNPLIVGCTIRNNRAEGQDGFDFGISGGHACGGGIFASDDSYLEIRNCSITDNTAIGGLAGAGWIGPPFPENGYAYGGGIYGVVTITNSTVSGNAAIGGPGVDMFGPAVTSARGGGIFARTNSSIANCLIAVNQVSVDPEQFGGNGLGGGICSESGGQVDIRNCTIVANTASGDPFLGHGYGGGVYSSSSTTIRSGILWGNAADDGPQAYGSGSVTYSDVQGGFPGEGNINADPCFADPVGGDYHLFIDSSCVNAGDPAYSPAPGETDIDGEPRVMGGRVDIGADEVCQGQPRIGRSPTEFRFDAVEGGQNPDRQVLLVGNVGSGTLIWEITEDCSWLGARPSRGQCTTEIDLIFLGVDISSLNPGLHSCELTVSSPCADNSPLSVPVNLYLYDGDQLHVPSEYGTIQEAIDWAWEGATVIVAPGVYTGTGNKNLDFAGKAITVRSTDPQDQGVVAATVIDCQNSGRGFYFHTGEDANSVVSGLTVRNGDVSHYGGGLYCKGSSPTISNCVITNNFSYKGGGIYCESGSNATIVGCTISNNEAIAPSPVDFGCGIDGFGGGIYCSWDSHATIVDSRITGNLALGSAGWGIIYPPPWGCDGFGYGGGIYGEATTISNCLIRGNTAVGACSMYGYGGAAFGGGICTGGVYIISATSASATTHVANCTIVDNSAVGACDEPWLPVCESAGGGVFGSMPVAMSDCILWGNTAGHDPQVGGECTVRYSNVQGGYSGTGNINANPLFVSGPAGNYYLSQVAAGQALQSPCVDAGSDLAVNLGLDDLTTRTDQFRDKGVVDMGYHYPAALGSPDINGDWFVNFVDYALLAGDWGKCELPYGLNCLPGDIVRNGCVDTKDLALMVDWWLYCFVELASRPKPADNAPLADPCTDLSWTAGRNAIYHDVYLGTDANAVYEADYSSPEYMGTFVDAIFDPCVLELRATHYWRVDEVGLGCTARGDVWSFTTWGEPNSHLVSWWRFDEGEGDVAYDSAGGNHGALIGEPNWAAGYIGSYALDFDGDGDYVRVPDDDTLTPHHAITISLWIYNRGGQTAGIYKYAPCAGSADSPGNSRAYVVQIMDADDKVNLRVFAGVNNYGDLFSANPVGLNEWRLITATFNAGDAAIYVDGQPDGSAVMPVSTIMNDAQPLTIGAVWSYCDGISLLSRLNGIADDVMIFDRALRTDEILQLYEAGL